MALKVGGIDVADVRVGGVPVEQVCVGSVEVWRRQSWILFDDATRTRYATTPVWARYADIVCLGAGGGGGGGDGALGATGSGGGAGKWQSATWTVDPGEQLSVNVGRGGAGGAKDTDGRAGRETYVNFTIAGRGLSCEAAGGAGGKGKSGGTPGQSPGSTTFFDTVFTGGGEAGTGVPGNPPGGGGGPGKGGTFGSADPGQPGANGQVWIRFRS